MVAGIRELQNYLTIPLNVASLTSISSRQKYKLKKYIYKWILVVVFSLFIPLLLRIPNSGLHPSAAATFRGQLHLIEATKAVQIQKVLQLWSKNAFFFSKDTPHPIPRFITCRSTRCLISWRLTQVDLKLEFQPSIMAKRVTDKLYIVSNQHNKLSLFGKFPKGREINQKSLIRNYPNDHKQYKSNIFSFFGKHNTLNVQFLTNDTTVKKMYSSVL